MNLPAGDFWIDPIDHDAWEAAERRMDCIGQNGPTGCHYESVQGVGKQDAIAQPNKYQRQLNGATVDVYDVLVAFNVTNPATAHAVKKLLMPGSRGHKDLLTDLREARDSIERAITLESAN